ncbi:NAD(P)/FAD-dependent oxidoreductase [Oscillatoria sp. CS-180]|uniref:NAD(P)/FAD-dependent oxidoreductase n=1 Tax=Oscillatoria sp. CS-180 TaxID=3021720 RepID=UPI002330384D|nr:NAD(P)/FAD-dependent oxidoreductase [Oscillatoria sp. CS-180]MDB9524481.1 NAD(P)/FAD-dependent oxidoreductase [Oscillatoria sp. CS-180]
MNSQNNEQILILGGGFAGLFAALHLCELKCPLPIKLIDRNTRFIFKPLLYELLSNEVQIELAWPHYDELLGDRDVTYVMGDIQRIDLDNQQVELKSGLTYGFSYLVIALGDSPGFFGVPGAQEHSFTFRTADDATGLAQQLRQKLQKAAQTTVVDERQRLLTVAIVGAGASGVELAVTLADLLPQWYEKLGGDVDEIRVVLLQRGAKILPNIANSAFREIVLDAFEQRRATIDLRLNSSVDSVSSDSLTYTCADEKQTLPTATTVWTAGSVTHPLVKQLPIADDHRDSRGRPYLTAALQIIGHPNVFAGGDCSVNVHEPKPTSAQVAYQQGKAIARNIQAMIEGNELKPSAIQLRGTLMKLGAEEGLAEILDRVRISGHAGHLIRQATYLNLVPTPERNLGLTAEWITDEIVSQFS